jgi:hypothetical protein
MALLESRRGTVCRWRIQSRPYPQRRSDRLGPKLLRTDCATRFALYAIIYDHGDTPNVWQAISFFKRVC